MKQLSDVVVEVALPQLSGPRDAILEARRLLVHLIEKNKKMEAVELYRKANKNTDSARILATIA